MKNYNVDDHIKKAISSYVLVPDWISSEWEVTMFKHYQTPNGQVVIPKDTTCHQCGIKFDLGVLSWRKDMSISEKGLNVVFNVRCPICNFHGSRIKRVSFADYLALSEQSIGNELN